MNVARAVRFAALSILMVAVVAVTGAKCIENDRLIVGIDGEWHVYGEIHNETDVQGLDMVLNGVLYDPNGRQLAIAQALMCPATLSPGTFSVFDVKLATDEATGDYRVNVAAGTASSDALVPLQGSFEAISTQAFYHQSLQKYLAGFDATFVLADEERVVVQPGGQPPTFTYCVAFYDANGKVIHILPPVSVATSADVHLTTKSGAPISTPSDFREIPNGAVSLRFLLWRGSGVYDTLSAPAISDQVPIAAQ